MKKMILAILASAVMAGCVTTPTVTTDDTSRSERITKVLDVATRINDATGRLMKLSGPTVVSVYCAVQPPNCPAATAAYSLALAAQKEYTAVLSDMTTANAAPDGTKLATLAATFQTHFAALSKLTGKTDMVEMTEFQKKLTELQAITAAQ